MVIIKTINPKRMGNLNCFLALAYGIVDAVSKETRPNPNFFIVISLGAGAFSKDQLKPETKRYLKSVNILLAVIAIVGTILVLFL